jgi:putative transposase
MKQRFTEEQIAFALKQIEEKLTSVPELSRKMGISQQTIYKWRNKYAGMGVSEVRKMKALEEENKQLKRLVADLSLDKHMLQDVLSKKF